MKVIINDFMTWSLGPEWTSSYWAYEAVGEVKMKWLEANMNTVVDIACRVVRATEEERRETIVPFEKRFVHMFEVGGIKYEFREPVKYSKTGEP